MVRPILASEAGIGDLGIGETGIGETVGRPNRVADPLGLIYFLTKVARTIKIKLE